MALRFPRLIRIREDKSTRECDTIQRIKELYNLKEEWANLSHIESRMWVLFNLRKLDKINVFKFM